MMGRLRFDLPFSGRICFPKQDLLARIRQNTAFDWTLSLSRLRLELGCRENNDGGFNTSSSLLCTDTVVRFPFTNLLSLSL